MTENLFERELRYQTMLIICRSLHDHGALSNAEFDAAEALLYEKYRPVFRNHTC